jgi:hypothetical protein
MNIRNTLAGAICAALATSSLAQTTAAPAPNPSSLASSVGLMVYPGKGQDAGTQAKDEVECYNWAKGQSGYDPASPPPTATVAAAAPPPPPPAGSRVRGAARGAAAGAVVGEIANNDADEGAKVGAAAGVVAAGSRNRQARRANEAASEQATQQAQAQADQANAAKAAGLEKFKSGMNMCLTERGYAVK